VTPDEKALRADPHPESWGVLADYLEDRGDPEAGRWRRLAAFAAAALPLLRRITWEVRKTVHLLPPEGRYGFKRVLNHVDAHDAFDPLWRSGRMSRTDAYRWLAGELGLDPEACHVALFDEELCQQAVAACASVLPATPGPRWTVLEARP
jgi:hypothetical protein